LIAGTEPRNWRGMRETTAPRDISKRSRQKWLSL
jgi:hypothetical protein